MQGQVWHATFNGADPPPNLCGRRALAFQEKEKVMPKPNLDDLDYDALTELIDEATNLRRTKFEGRELDEKRRRPERDMEIERKVDPFRTPTA